MFKPCQAAFHVANWLLLLLFDAYLNEACGLAISFNCLHISYSRVGAVMHDTIFSNPAQYALLSDLCCRLTKKLNYLADINVEWYFPQSHFQNYTHDLFTTMQTWIILVNTCMSMNTISWGIHARSIILFDSIIIIRLSQILVTYISLFFLFLGSDPLHSKIFPVIIILCKVISGVHPSISSYNIHLLHIMLNWCHVEVLFMFSASL